MLALLVCAACQCTLISGSISSVGQAGMPEQPPGVAQTVAGRPLREIAARLTEQTGASVNVDERIAQWKATVVYRGPLDVLLECLCETFGLKIERGDVQSDRETDTPRYFLRLDDEEAERLEGLAGVRNRKAAEMARRDAQQMIGTIRDLLVHPDRRVRVTDEGPISPLTEGAEPMLDLIGSLDPGLTEKVVASRRRAIPEYDKSPSVVLAMAELSPPQRALVRAFLTSTLSGLHAAGDTGTTYADNLQAAVRELERSRIGFWVLNNRTAQTLHMSVYTPGQLWSPDFPIVHAEASGTPTAPAPNSRATSKNLREPLPDAKVDLTLDDVGYAEAVLTLAESAHLQVVADAFCLHTRAKGRWVKRSLRVVLEEFCNQLQLNRDWLGEVLLLRAQGWEDLLPEEPPASVLDTLGKALDDTGSVTLDVLANAAASMRREHTAGLCRWSSPKGASGTPVANALGTGFAVWK